MDRIAAARRPAKIRPRLRDKELEKAHLAFFRRRSDFQGRRGIEPQNVTTPKLIGFTDEAALH